MSKRAWAVTVTTALCLAACVPEPQSGTSGGNTSWLRRCSAQSECGGYEACVGGVCMPQCSSESQCQALTPAGSCVDMANSSISPSCRTQSPVCMPMCTGTDECKSLSSGLVCRQGSCQPACDEGARGDAGDPNAADANDALDAGDAGDARSRTVPASAKYKLLPEEVVSAAVTRLEDGTFFVFAQSVHDSSMTIGPRVAYRYDTARDAWSALPSPTDEAASQGYPPDCFVFPLAGRRVLEVDSVSGQKATARIFDVGSETWQSVTKLEGYLLEQVVSLPQGDALAVLTDAVHRFDAETSTWAAVGVPPYRPVTGATARLSDGRVLNVNGSAAEAALFDPDTNQWQSVTAPRIVRDSPSLVGLPDGRALLAGGVFVGTSRSTEVQTELFDPNTNAWTDGPKLPSPEAMPSLQVAGRIVYTFGGLTSPCSAYLCGGKAVYAIDIDTMTITALPELSFATAPRTLEVSPGRYLVIGGAAYGWYDVTTGPSGDPWTD